LRIARLKIKGFRGANDADISLGQHTVLVGPNNSGKTTLIEALALLLGRDRLVRRLTEHDFYGSNPEAATRILIIATLTDFPHDDPHHVGAWFGMDRGGVDKWLDPVTNDLHATRENASWRLAVQIGFAARFDCDELEPYTIRFFVDEEQDLGDPFAEGAHLKTIPSQTLQELGYFLVPASRTWDRWISFSSELFRRVISARGGMPAETIRAERQRLWNPPDDEKLEGHSGLNDIVSAANEELRHLISASPQLQLRLTGTDSDSVLEAVVPHFTQSQSPTLPASRHGSGLVSMQSLLLLMQLGRARAQNGKSFFLAVEEPELHIQPSQQKRLVNRLNALCDQTIITTHSPVVAAMFSPSETLFVNTKDGTLTARPLIKAMPAAPTNHQQHLFFGWRQRLVTALMHDHVLIPEGPSDVAWLEALQTALETRQTWRVDEVDLTRFGTFVGVVPTNDAKILETYEIVSAVHSRGAVLLDGDKAGRGYFDAIRQKHRPPYRVILWPDGWEMENVVTWIASADRENTLQALGNALGETFATENDLSNFLLAKKSYGPTHETVAVTLIINQACQDRIAQLLGGLADVLRGAAVPPLFQRREVDSTIDMEVWNLTP
jgi:putative ATP-dependent endonuclease of the OLD family